MVGHWVILAEAYAEVRDWLSKTGIPVITTLLGISAFPDGHPLHLGMPGMHGEVHVNRAIQNADASSVSFAVRRPGHGQHEPARTQARIVHIDLDRAGDRGRTVPVAVGIVGDARDHHAPPGGGGGAAPVRALGRTHPRVRTHASGVVSGRPVAEAILASIYEASHGEGTIVTDVGQHQMWVAKLIPYQRPNTHITSGGLGAMGFAVPAAMGVHLARPSGTVWAISGDGGFQMNMAEMATMVQEGLPVKMAVFNNGLPRDGATVQQFFHEKALPRGTPI